jgi:hypothetical protein
MSATGDPANDPPADDPRAPLRSFMASVIAPEHALGVSRELGVTPLARQLGLTDDRLSGHWCRRCQGIWYGWPLEVQCPCCGARGG